MTSEKEAEWLRSARYFGNLPLTVTIGKQSYPGCEVSATGGKILPLWETCPQVIDIYPRMPIGSPMIRGSGIRCYWQGGDLFPPIKNIITRSDIALFSSRGFTVNLSTTGRENHIGVTLATIGD